MLTQLQEPTTVRADQLDQLLLKRPITVKALVTPLWKDEAQQQLQAQINQLDGQLQQLDEQVQQMIGKLQQQSLQIVGVGGNSGETQAQIQNIQMQAGDRKDELLDQKNQILDQINQVQALDLEQEVEQGQIDSFFHVQKGDHLIRKMQVEVLLRDGVLEEIRGDL
jgi:flagellar hook-associated protein FlgK